jgi:hypothetical protein
MHLWSKEDVLTMCAAGSNYSPFWWTNCWWQTGSQRCLWWKGLTLWLTQVRHCNGSPPGRHPALESCSEKHSFVQQSCWADMSATFPPSRSFLETSRLTHLPWFLSPLSLSCMPCMTTSCHSQWSLEAGHYLLISMACCPQGYWGFCPHIFTQLPALEHLLLMDSRKCVTANNLKSHFKKMNSSSQVGLLLVVSLLEEKNRAKQSCLLACLLFSWARRHYRHRNSWF